MRGSLRTRAYLARRRIRLDGYGFCAAADDIPSPGPPMVIERVRFDHKDAAPRLAEALLQTAGPVAAGCDRCVVVCVGSDRSTGDSLGPLVGSGMEAMALPELLVLGTLESPVHAGNMAEALRSIEEAARRPIILAVDASLGRPEQVGSIALASGALRPGAGVNKKLPPLGHMHITGTVNVGGFMEYVVLQNTRLSIVVKMAQVIIAALSSALPRLCTIMRASYELPPLSIPGCALPRLSPEPYRMPATSRESPDLIRLPRSSPRQG